jgi:outer membrane protein
MTKSSPSIPALLLPLLLSACALPPREVSHPANQGPSPTIGTPPTAAKNPSSDLLKDLRRDDESPVLNQSVTLEEAVRLAHESNRKRPASRFSIAIAEAQHRQALSAYWPQLNMTGTVNQRSDDVNFIFPETTLTTAPMTFTSPAFDLTTPATNLQTPATSFTIPAGAFGPGFPPANINVPVASQNVAVGPQTMRVPAQEIYVPSSTITVPEQDVTVMDRTTYGGALSLKWLLWDGGMRKNLSAQAKQAIKAASEDARRTDLEIIRDVTRMYHGAVLSKEIEALGFDALAKMDAILQLTESLYKGDSMNVKKTDYLRNKVVVENLRMMVSQLTKNRELAESALTHSMGYSWTSKIKPTHKSLAFSPINSDLEGLISSAYEYNTDWRKVGIGIQAAEAKVAQERSGHLPKLAMLNNAHRIANGASGGFATDQNLNAWNVGVGVEIPLFDGMLTRNKVNEAKARLSQMKEQKVLLREGLALQIKALFLKLQNLETQHGTSASADQAATENRELSEKAYRGDMIAADKVFEAQLMESFVKAQRLKLRFDHLDTQSELNLLVGRNLYEQLGTL